MSICLNLEIVTNTCFSYYPISNLYAFSKAFIKELCFDKNQSFCLNILSRSALNLAVCFIGVPKFNFKNTASTSLILLNCADVANLPVFFRKREMKSFKGQKIVTAFLFLLRLDSAALFVTENFIFHFSYDEILFLFCIWWFPLL